MNESDYYLLYRYKTDNLTKREALKTDKNVVSSINKVLKFLLFLIMMLLMSNSL